MTVSLVVAFTDTEFVDTVPMLSSADKTVTVYIGAVFSTMFTPDDVTMIYCTLSHVEVISEDVNCGPFSSPIFTPIFL